MYRSQGSVVAKDRSSRNRTRNLVRKSALISTPSSHRSLVAEQDEGSIRRMEVEQMDDSMGHMLVKQSFGSPRGMGFLLPQDSWLALEVEDDALEATKATPKSTSSSKTRTPKRTAESCPATPKTITPAAPIIRTLVRSTAGLLQSQDSWLQLDVVGEDTSLSSSKKSQLSSALPRTNFVADICVSAWKFE
jgi:hypothetical protein